MTSTLRSVAEESSAQGRAEDREEQPGYIPPAPGGSSADVKAELGQSDIIETVMANKAALASAARSSTRRTPAIRASW